MNAVLQSVPLWSRSWMFSVLCTVRPSLLAKAWSKGVFPLETRAEQSVFRMREWVQGLILLYYCTLGQCKYTMFIPCIDISAHIQQAQQAGESLRLLAGEIQRTALVDLSSSICVICIKAEEMPWEDINPRVTVASPCLSFQRLLLGRPAASPCLACSSKPLYVEDCSTTLGLRVETNIHITQTGYSSLKFLPTHTGCWAILMAA